MSTTANRFAKKLLLSIGKLSVVVAGEVLKRHGVTENHLAFYSDKDINWLMDETNKVNKLNEHVYNNAKSRFIADQFYGLYRTKRFLLGKIIPGDRLETYNQVNTFIRHYLTAENKADVSSVSKEHQVVIKKITKLMDENIILDIHPAIKHNEVYITVYFQPK